MSTAPRSPQLAWAQAFTREALGARVFVNQTVIVYQGDYMYRRNVGLAVDERTGYPLPMQSAVVAWGPGSRR